MYGSWKLVAVIVLLAFAAGLGLEFNHGISGANALDAQGGHGKPEPPMLGVHYARGNGGRPRQTSPNLVYHGGPVMTSPSQVTAIFWGSSWPSYAGDKISGIDSFYGGVGGSSYASTNTEYTNAAASSVSASVSYTGHSVDNAAAPRGAPSTSANVLAVVAATISNTGAERLLPRLQRPAARACQLLRMA